MYYGGHGVAQNYAQALKWLNLAADQGLAEAQHDLGLMYGHGHGVSLDYIQARMWSNIAGAQGHDKALKGRDILAKKMTLIQIAEAQRLARDWSARQNEE